MRVLAMGARRHLRLNFFPERLPPVGTGSGKATHPTRGLARYSCADRLGNRDTERDTRDREQGRARVSRKKWRQQVSSPADAIPELKILVSAVQSRPSPPLISRPPATT